MLLKEKSTQQRNTDKITGAYFRVIPFVCFGIVVFYILGTVLRLEENPPLVQVAMAISLAMLSISSLYFIFIKRDTRDRYRFVICGLILAGLILRTGYMLYTPCNVRSHDLWKFDMESGGHAGYILTLMKEHRLPDSNYRQYYQQPLFYLLGSVFSFIANGILQRGGEYDLVNAAKLVSCIASSVSFLTVVPLCEELRIGKKGKVIALLCSLSLPSVIYASGMVCPDALTMMFFTLTFYLTFCWSRNPGIGMTVLLAFAYGFAIQTKISCGLMALFTAAVFLYALVGKRHADKRLMLVGNYVIFGLISFPLGLWFCVRNKILFDQSFTYVLPLNPKGELYTGDYSVLQRLFIIPFDNLFATPYGNTYTDYNLPLFLIKSSLFGEWEPGNALPRVLLYCMLAAVILLSVLTIAAAIFCLFKREKKVLFTAGIFFALILSANFFYLKYPFGCSMDFRYYIFLTVPAGLLLARASEYLKIKWAENVLMGVCSLSAVLNIVFLLLL